MTKKGSKKRRKCNLLDASSPESKSEMPKRLKLRSLSETDKGELETLFNKKLTYTQSVTSDRAGWINNLMLRLEDIKKTSIVWQDDNLMELKKDINTLKDQLSGKDIESWHNHTTECNLAGKIIPYVKSLGVELGTQAWVKFYEIVNTFNIVPDQPFISVHLCEAPGAFIASLNHHLWQTDFPYDWDWCATTLNPYDESNSLSEMIADDRLIRHTHHKWYFGLDGSGDIRADEHIEGLMDKVQQMEREMRAKVFLVTADGSKDCQANPGEQESLLSELHYCEMLAACLMLAPGGCLVLKIFTMFEVATINLMTLLNILFETVNLFKPATSKSGNSEMYVVCTGYLANVERKVLWTMLRAVRESSVTCFIKENEIAQEFLQEHRHFCHQFSKWQSDTINRNIRLFDMHPTQFYDQLKQQQEFAIDRFVDNTSISCNRETYRLVPFIRDKSMFYVESPSSHASHYHPATSKVFGSPPVGGFQHKNLKGTFHLRQNFSALSFKERIQLMEIREVFKPATVLTCRCSVTDKEVEWWASAQETASFPSHVYNSRLCDSSVLDDYNFLLQHSQFLQLCDEQKEDHIKNLASILLRAVELFMPSQHSQYSSYTQQRSQPQSHPDKTHDFHHHQQHHHHHEYQHGPQQGANQPDHTIHTDGLGNLSQLTVSPNKQTGLKSNHPQDPYHKPIHSKSNVRSLPSPEKMHYDQSTRQKNNAVSRSKYKTRFTPSPEKPHNKSLMCNPESPSRLQDNPDLYSTKSNTSTPEKPCSEQSTSFQQSPESHSKRNTRPAPDPEKHDCRLPTPQQHNPTSPVLKLVVVKNGCCGDDFSSFLKTLSLEAHNERTQHIVGRIEVEVRDLEMNLGTRGVKCDNTHSDGGCDVAYFVNMTRLLCNEEDFLSRTGGEQGMHDVLKETPFAASSSIPANCEELKTRQFSLDQISLILKRLPSGSNLVLLTSSFLTRFHSGLLYVVARHFNQVQVTSDPNLWSHQAVVCRGFKGMTSPRLLQQLSPIQGSVEGSDKGFVETVKFTHIINDRKFSQFVTAHNNFLLSGFINLVLAHHKEGIVPGKDQDNKNVC